MSAFVQKTTSLPVFIAAEMRAIERVCRAQRTILLNPLSSWQLNDEGHASPNHSSWDSLGSVKLVYLQKERSKLQVLN